MKNRDRNAARETMIGMVRTLICAWCGVCMAGCFTHRSPYVHVTFLNVGTQDLKEVYAYFGHREAMAGWLVAGGSAGHMYFNGPITPEARVVFRRGDGPLMERVVAVVIPPMQEKIDSYELVFRINSDQETVMFSLGDIKQKKTLLGLAKKPDDIRRERKTALAPIHLAGKWVIAGPYNVGKPCEIMQTATSLVFVNESDGRSDGAFEGENSVVALDWDGLRGTVTDDSTRIDWRNGTWWIRTPQ
jgi:hypothetical protein